MTLPRSVVIGGCFAPDGLQNEDAFVATDLEVRFVEAAAEAGFTGNACTEDLVAMFDGLRLEAFLSGTLRGTEDAVEGPKAFAEKRKPVFKAR